MFINCTEIFIGLNWKSPLFQQVTTHSFCEIRMPNLVGSEESPHLLLLWKAPKEPPPCCVTKVNLEVWGEMGLLAVKTHISITRLFIMWDYLFRCACTQQTRLDSKEPTLKVCLHFFFRKSCYSTFVFVDVITLCAAGIQWLSGGRRLFILSVYPNVSAPL